MRLWGVLGVGPLPPADSPLSCVSLQMEFLSLLQWIHSWEVLQRVAVSTGFMGTHPLRCGTHRRISRNWDYLV